MLPVLVAAGPAAADAEVLAFGPATRNASAQIPLDPLELFSGHDRNEGIALHMAEHEIAVFLRMHREQFGIEGGEIATRIHIHDRKGIVHVGALDAAVAAGQIAEALKFPHPHVLGPFLPELPEPLQELGVQRFGVRTAEGGLQILPLGFLHVEGHIADAVVHEELEHRLGMVQRLLGEHTDHLEMDAAALQSGDAAHRGRMAAEPRAGAAVAIVQEGRSIEAHAHVDAVARKAVAPGIVDHHGVGLHRLADLQRRPRPALLGAANMFTGLVVEADRQGEGFARMPEQGEVTP